MGGYCRNCMKWDSYIGYGRKRFCSNACRQAAYRKRRSERNGGVTNSLVSRNASGCIGRRGVR